MMMRRTNSWISPPNTSAAPQATMARREIVNATGPVMSFFSVVSGASQGRLPQPAAAAKRCMRMGRRQQDQRDQQERQPVEAP
jgi:hypothetical protein